MIKNWQKVIVKATDTIEYTIRIIDEGSLQVALVVDDDGRLLGVVTDGDIRRGLLRHISLEQPINRIMNTSPTIALPESSKDELLTLLDTHQISQIPIVDSNSYLLGLETKYSISSTKEKENSVFLMAGGFGTRLKPLTDHCPKPLLKVGDKPILETIIENFIAQRFRKFYISVHYKAEMIKNYFGDGHRWGIEIEYIEEKKPLGTGGSLGLLSNKLTAPFIVMNADLLTKLNFEQLLLFHTEKKSAVTMAVRSHALEIPYGTVELEGDKIIKLVEKPTHRFFVNAGIYVLNPEILTVIKQETYLDMPDLINQLIKSNTAINLFPVHEYWLDIGRSSDFQKVQTEIDKVFK